MEPIRCVQKALDSCLRREAVVFPQAFAIEDQDEGCGVTGDNRHMSAMLHHGPMAGVRQMSVATNNGIGR